MKKFVSLACVLLLAGCATTPSQTTYYRDVPAGTRYVPVTNFQPAPAPVTTQDEYNKKVIKQGLMGAAVGAIAAETSGGKAGQGALVGAGTNVLGSALFDVLTAPSAQPQQVTTAYAPYANQWTQQNQNNKKIIRKYDNNGNIVSEEVWEG